VVRALDVFAWTFSVSVPLPVPPADVAVIHEGRPETVHAQPAAVVTATSIEPPLAAALKLAGFIANEHGSCEAFSWLTVTT
jgi:hypothetical protein